MNLNAIDPVSRRDAIKTLMAGAAAASLPALRGADAPQSTQKPHVFLIMTDQQKASATSIYGNRFVHTPTWARVAGEGVTFDCAYGQNPICTPSRTSIMTGTYPPVHQVFCHQNHAPKNVPQLA